MSSAEKLTVLAEEFGEVAHEVNEGIGEGREVNIDKLRKELVQTAAVASAWVETFLERETVFDGIDIEIGREKLPANDVDRFGILSKRFGVITASMVVVNPRVLDRHLERFAAVCVQ